MQPAPPALVQPAPPAPALPPGFPLPEGLLLKAQGFEAWDFDQESMEVRNPATAALVRVPVEGRTWRFVLRSEARMGALSMLERLKPALASAGWTWTWPERGIARRTEGADAWFRATAGPGGELRCVLVEKGPPPQLSLQAPGPTPESPKPQEDFPYLAPWPGAAILACAPSQSPVGVRMPNGQERMVMVTFVEKEYQLARPVSSHAFLTAYRAALLKAGWEIEGFQRGPVLQLQAYYERGGRDLRAVLRLAGDAMGISVADVGAQVPKGGK